MTDQTDKEQTFYASQINSNTTQGETEPIKSILPKKNSNMLADQEVCFI